VGLRRAALTICSGRQARLCERELVCTHLIFGMGARRSCLLRREPRCEALQFRLPPIEGILRHALLGAEGSSRSSVKLCGLAQPASLCTIAFDGAALLVDAA